MTNININKYADLLCIIFIYNFYSYSLCLWADLFIDIHEHTHSLSRSLIIRFTTPHKIKMPLFMPHSNFGRFAFLGYTIYAFRHMSSGICVKISFSEVT